MTGARHAIVGAGIVGLALARALVRHGHRVTLFDAHPRPQGASIRNFGTLWPIGQPSGPRRDLALRSLAIWREVLAESDAWCQPCGSLHLAHHPDELRVLEEFAGRADADGFACEVISPGAALAHCRRVRGEGLLGALWSPHEIQVNPRQAVERITEWLRRDHGVEVVFGTRVTDCEGGLVRSGRRVWEVDHVWLATGDDLGTLYPEEFAAAGLQRCKLQMMRTAPVPWRLGPILAGGLTLAHYAGFAACPGLPALAERLDRDWPHQRREGVHVLVAQHEAGHLLLGDSHEYDADITPFDRPAVDALVLQYLDTLLAAPTGELVERWHGIYVKHPSAPYVVLSPADGVTAVAGLGGHGMTLSFGLAEQLVAAHLAADALTQETPA